MTSRFEGKVALITGAASGIGRFTAQAFGEVGAKVVATTDANVAGAEETVKLIREAGGEATSLQCDVTKADQVEALILRIVATYGRLDIAFNNAGVGPDGHRIPVAPITEISEEVWDRTINVNLKGVWLCMKYEIRQMLKQGGGAIVNTSSVGGMKFIPGFGPYAASKSGVIGLTKTAALECAAQGIRVNAICPGPTANTQLVENMLSTNPHAAEGMIKAVPMARLCEPQEIARTVLWLCSDEASFVTGHAMSIDGGLAAS